MLLNNPPDFEVWTGYWLVGIRDHLIWDFWAHLGLFLIPCPKNNLSSSPSSLRINVGAPNARASIASCVTFCNLLSISSSFAISTYLRLSDSAIPARTSASLSTALLVMSRSRFQICIQISCEARSNRSGCSRSTVVNTRSARRDPLSTRVVAGSLSPSIGTEPINVQIPVNPIYAYFWWSFEVGRDRKSCKTFYL